MHRRVCLGFCAAVVFSSLLSVLVFNKFGQFTLVHKTLMRQKNLQYFTLNTPALTDAPAATPPPLAVDRSHDATGDKSWRQTNRLVVQYRPQIAEQLTALVARSAGADDPEVISLAHALIDPVPQTAAIGIKRSREFVKTPQAAEVETITRRMVN
jgi:hypothetical protein